MLSENTIYHVLYQTRDGHWHVRQNQKRHQPQEYLRDAALREMGSLIQKKTARAVKIVCPILPIGVPSPVEAPDPTVIPGVRTIESDFATTIPGLKVIDEN